MENRNKSEHNWEQQFNEIREKIIVSLEEACECVQSSNVLINEQALSHKNIVGDNQTGSVWMKKSHSLKHRRELDLMICELSEKLSDLVIDHNISDEKSSATGTRVKMNHNFGMSASDDLFDITVASLRFFDLRLNELKYLHESLSMSEIHTIDLKSRFIETLCDMIPVLFIYWQLHVFRGIFVLGILIIGDMTTEIATQNDCPLSYNCHETTDVYEGTSYIFKSFVDHDVVGDLHLPLCRVVDLMRTCLECETITRIIHSLRRTSNKGMKLPDEILSGNLSILRDFSCVILDYRVHLELKESALRLVNMQVFTMRVSLLHQHRFDFHDNDLHEVQRLLCGLTRYTGSNICAILLTDSSPTRISLFTTHVLEVISLSAAIASRLCKDRNDMTEGGESENIVSTFVLSVVKSVLHLGGKNNEESTDFLNETSSDDGSSDILLSGFASFVRNLLDHTQLSFLRISSEIVRRILAQLRFVRLNSSILFEDEKNALFCRMSVVGRMLGIVIMGLSHLMYLPETAVLRIPYYSTLIKRNSAIPLHQTLHHRALPTISPWALDCLRFLANGSCYPYELLRSKDSFHSEDKYLREFFVTWLHSLRDNDSYGYFVNETESSTPQFNSEFLRERDQQFLSEIFSFLPHLNFALSELHSVTDNSSMVVRRCCVCELGSITCFLRKVVASHLSSPNIVYFGPPKEIGMLLQSAQQQVLERLSDISMSIRNLVMSFSEIYLDECLSAPFEILEKSLIPCITGELILDSLTVALNSDCEVTTNRSRVILLSYLDKCLMRCTRYSELATGTSDSYDIWRHTTPESYIKTLDPFNHQYIHILHSLAFSMWNSDLARMISRIWFESTILLGDKTICTASVNMEDVSHDQLDGVIKDDITVSNEVQLVDMLPFVKLVISLKNRKVNILLLLMIHWREESRLECEEFIRRMIRMALFHMKAGIREVDCRDENEIKIYQKRLPVDTKVMDPIMETFQETGGFQWSVVDFRWKIKTDLCSFACLLKNTCVLLKLSTTSLLNSMDDLMRISVSILDVYTKGLMLRDCMYCEFEKHSEYNENAFTTYRLLFPMDSESGYPSPLLTFIRELFIAVHMFLELFFRDNPFGRSRILSLDTFTETLENGITAQLIPVFLLPVSISILKLMIEKHSGSIVIDRGGSSPIFDSQNRKHTWELFDSFVVNIYDAAELISCPYTGERKNRIIYSCFFVGCSNYKNGNSNILGRLKDSLGKLVYHEDREIASAALFAVTSKPYFCVNSPYPDWIKMVKLLEYGFASPGLEALTVTILLRISRLIERRISEGQTESQLEIDARPSHDISKSIKTFSILSFGYLHFLKSLSCDLVKSVVLGDQIKEARLVLQNLNIILRLLPFLYSFGFISSIDIVSHVTPMSICKLPVVLTKPSQTTFLEQHVGGKKVLEDVHCEIPSIIAKEFSTLSTSIVVRILLKNQNLLISRLHVVLLNLCFKLKLDSNWSYNNDMNVEFSGDYDKSVFDILRFNTLLTSLCCPPGTCSKAISGESVKRGGVRKNCKPIPRTDDNEGLVDNDYSRKAFHDLQKLSQSHCIREMVFSRALRYILHGEQIECRDLSRQKVLIASVIDIIEFLAVSDKNIMEILTGVVMCSSDYPCGEDGRFSLSQLSALPENPNELVTNYSEMKRIFNEDTLHETTEPVVLEYSGDGSHFRIDFLFFKAIGYLRKRVVSGFSCPGGGAVSGFISWLKTERPHDGSKGRDVEYEFCPPNISPSKDDSECKHAGDSEKGILTGMTGKNKRHRDILECQHKSGEQVNSKDAKFFSPDCGKYIKKRRIYKKTPPTTRHIKEVLNNDHPNTEDVKLDDNQHEIIIL